MFIKHFREVRYRVPDPVHPGHSVFTSRMDSSGAHRINHGGKSYEADSDGWFDVPDEVGRHFVKADGTGFPGWCTPEMVDEEKVAGRIRPDDADALPNTRAELEKEHKPRGPKKPSAPKKPREPRKPRAPKKPKAESSKTEGAEKAE